MKQAISLSILALVLLATSGCTTEEMEELHIAANPWPGYGYLFLADELKLLVKENTRVVIHRTSDLNENRELYARGVVDGFAGTFGEYLSMLSNDTRKPRLVNVTDFSSGADIIVAASGITSINQLVGKTVGVDGSDLSTFLLRRALESAQVPVEAVKPLRLPKEKMAEKLKRGELAAVVSYPPTSFALRAAVRDTNILFSSKDIPREIIDVIVIDKDALSNKKNAVRLLLSAYLEAQTRFENDPDTLSEAFASSLTVSVENLRKSLSEITILSPCDQWSTLYDKTTLREIAHRLAPHSAKLVFRAGTQVDDGPLREILTNRCLH